MSGKITLIKGVHDVLPPEIHSWHRLEDSARRVFTAYGYDEIRIPVIEKTALFARSIGAETDVVSKEMYTFTDPGEESITLRPEGTAGVVRAFIQQGIAQSRPQSRFWYAGPMFRRERPQKGRQRQFSQIGAEGFGEASPRADAEMLVLVRDLLDDAGIRTVATQLSSLGDERCRPAYRARLQEFLRGVAGSLCEDCSRRAETNPLRVLDCKKPGCRAATADAPLLLDHLCGPCRDHFAEVRRNLALAGAGYEVNPRIVRGLDYYVRTAFELVDGSGALGSQAAVGGGGRYDGLVQQLGGPPVPGIGFGLGVERLVMVLESRDTAHRGVPLAWIVAPGPEAQDEGVRLARALRAIGVRTILGFDAKPNAFAKELERAHKRGAHAAVILGPDELAKRTAQVKDLRAGTQVEERLDAAAIAARIAAMNGAT